MADDNDIIVRLKAEGVEKFKTDISSTTKSVDSLSVSITEVGTESAKSFNTLTTETNEANQALKSTETTAKSFRAQMRDLKAEITGINLEMGKLQDEGKQGTAQFEALRRKAKELTDQAGRLDDAMKDAAQTIGQAGSDTRGIDQALRAVTSLSAGFQVTQGAAALFGGESAQLQQTLVKLNAVMSITSGLQQIQAEALRNDSVFTAAATKAKAAFNLVVGQGTIVTKAFRLALASTGIGLLVIGLG